MVRSAINRGFEGRLYCVNPNYKEIEGVPCFPTIADLPEPVERHPADSFLPLAPSEALQPKDYFLGGSPGAFQSADNSVAWIYATQRRGGRMIYAFDVSSPEAPLFKWRAGCPNLGNDTGCTAGMSRIGHNWSTPSVAFIKGYSTTTPVVLVGGGYDACWWTSTTTASSTTRTSPTSGGTSTGSTSSRPRRRPRRPRAASGRCATSRTRAAPAQSTGHRTGT